MRIFQKIILAALCMPFLACSNDDDNQPIVEVTDPSVLDDDVIGLKMELPSKSTIVSRVVIGDTVTTIDSSWNIKVRAYGHMQKGDRSFNMMGIYDYGGNPVNEPQLESLDKPYNKTWAVTWPPLGDDKRYAKWSYIWSDNGSTEGKGVYIVDGKTCHAKGIRYVDIVAVGMAVENNSWHLKFEYNGGEAINAGCSNTEFVFYPWESYVSYEDELAHDVIIATSFDNDAKTRPVLNVKYKHVMSQLRFILKTDRTDITDENRFTFHFAYLPMWGIYNYVTDTWRNVTCGSGSNYDTGGGGTYDAGGLYLTKTDVANAAKIGDTLGVIIIPGDYTANKLMKYKQSTNMGANGNTNHVVNNEKVDNWIPMLYPAKKNDEGGYDPMHSDYSNDPYNPDHYIKGTFSGEVYEPGKIYQYNLVYSSDGVYITPLSVIDWDESGMDGSMTLCGEEQ